jgi:hypothetical protein
MVIVRSSAGVSVKSRAKFRYVYDCGSRQAKRCRTLAKRFAATVEDRTIDLLFLSHFDDDHVNSVPDLLDPVDGVRAVTIVLPLVDDVERLIAFGRAISRRRAVGDFFRAFVVDPVSTLGTLRPDRILLVRRGTDDPDDRGTVDLGPTERDPDRPLRAKMVPTDQAFRAGPSRPIRVTGTSADVHVVYDDMDIEVTGSFGFGPWILKPYVRPCDPARINRFEREAERLLGWPWGSFRNKASDPAVRSDVVTDAARSKALAAAYKAAFGDRNLTSLCLYSGPRSAASMDTSLIYDLLRNNDSAKIGWLATGDAPLKDPSEAGDFLTHFKDQADSVVTLGLPHHGSAKNYSPAVVAALRPNSCFVSAKPPKNWRHPDPLVMADVANQGVAGIHIDDKDSTTFCETFLIVT